MNHPPQKLQNESHTEQAAGRNEFSHLSCLRRHDCVLWPTATEGKALLSSLCKHTLINTGLSMNSVLPLSSVIWSWFCSALGSYLLFGWCAVWEWCACQTHTSSLIKHGCDDSLDFSPVILHFALDDLQECNSHKTYISNEFSAKTVQSKTETSFSGQFLTYSCCHNLCNVCVSLAWPLNCVRLHCFGILPPGAITACLMHKFHWSPSV